MSTLSKIILLLIPVAAVAVSVLVANNTMKKSGNMKKSFVHHLASLSLVILAGGLLAATANAVSVTPMVEAASDEVVKGGFAQGMQYLSAGLAFGMAAIGGGIALSGALPAAIGSVAEDAKMFGKAIIFAALGEAIALYGIVILFIILGS